MNHKNLKPYENSKELVNDLLLFANNILINFYEKNNNIQINSYNRCFSADEEIISEKIKLSKASLTCFPFLNIYESLNLSFFQIYCIFLSVFYELREDYSNVFYNLDKSYYTPTLRLAVNSYEAYLNRKLSFKEIFDEFDFMFKKTFFETNLYSHKNIWDFPLVINKEILVSLLDSKNKKKLLNTSHIFNTVLPLKIAKTLYDSDSVKKIVDLVRKNEKSAENLGVQIIGENGIGRKFHLEQSAYLLNKKIVYINLSLMENDENYLYSIYREAILENALICITDYEYFINSFKTENKEFFFCSALDIFFKLKQPVFIITENKNPIKLYSSCVNIYIRINIGKNEKLAIWKFLSSSVEFDEKIDFNEVFNKFNISVGTMAFAVNFIKTNQNITGKKISEKILYESFYIKTLETLDSKATKIIPEYSFDDLILPGEQKNQLIHACNFIKLNHIVFDKWNFKKRFPYGNGLNILFEGPPGTGKTMAAQVVAKYLGLNIYRINISQSVSKYIGETEENLRKIFDEAEKSNIILFIDEMDALFGKRTDVKNSRDRYSNMETSYLLQRIETYKGVVLMSTNYISNIDEAFFRRIHFIIHFPFPNFTERKNLWKGMFPLSAPLNSNIDFDFLSENFELSGGQIKNIALKAAFKAAAKNQKISMKHIVTSIKDEVSKQNKILLKDDFKEYGYLVD